MKRFAVGHFSMDSNELHIEIVHAENAESAPQHHSMFGISYFDDMDFDILVEPKLETMKRFAFDCDEGLDVVEIRDFDEDE